MKKSDPTKNVLMLVDAEMKRVNEILALRTDHDRQVRELEKEIRVAESRRIDANRTVDMQAVVVANDRAVNQAALLAKQLETSVESLRAQISALQLSQYENKGKSGVTSPLLMMIALLIGGIVVWAIETMIRK